MHRGCRIKKENNGMEKRAKNQEAWQSVNQVYYKNHQYFKVSISRSTKPSSGSGTGGMVVIEDNNLYCVFNLSFVNGRSRAELYANSRLYSSSNLLLDLFINAFKVKSKLLQNTAQSIFLACR
eukprot:NODE_159_length_16647_cov_0.251390.p7 type:complete len:123 gc:universal NODE_159_length_16647_cov_0.251390:14186-14554(+)